MDEKLGLQADQVVPISWGQRSLEELKDTSVRWIAVECGGLGAGASA